MDDVLVVYLEFRAKMKEFAEEQYSPLSIFAVVFGFPFLCFVGRIISHYATGADMMGWIGVGVLFGGMVLIGLAFHSMLEVHAKHSTSRKLLPLSERLIEMRLAQLKQPPEEIIA